MSIPILSTKLYMPRPRPQVVQRPRLIQRLNQGRFGRLTLISAPAGFGKTTLLSEWIAGDQRPVAWLSLDENDSDLPRFLSYLIAALRTLGQQRVESMTPEFGAELLTSLDSAQPPPLESTLTALINEIATISQDFTLVLDDYHVLDSVPVDSVPMDEALTLPVNKALTVPVDEALTFMLEHLPSQLHLVVTTREDPPLPLARYRARGQLTEIRAADLRFTADEAAEFLNQMMGLTLSSEEIDALEARTEGWIAGLQMAAISLQGRTETTDFVQAFTGSHRFVLDFLVEEVLHRQSDGVRSFLLQTSILERLSGPLCDAVTGQSSSSAMLETLERDNLFVVPLDDHRRWYRYHHLFGDVLQAHAADEQPVALSTLHSRASLWHEQNGQPADAIRHALLAADFERAAHLIELSWRAMDRDFQAATWFGWVSALPEESVRARPVLCVGYAWALLDDGQLDAVEPWLYHAEQWLALSSATETHREPAVSDEAEFLTLPVTIASARAYLAQAQGDTASTVKYARRALDLLPEDDLLGRAIPGALLGLAYWAQGSLSAAYQAMFDSMESFRKSGNPLLAVSGAPGLADIKIASGRLHEAMQVCKHFLALATSQNGPPLRATADLYLTLSELYRELGEPSTATRYLQQSVESGEQSGSPHWPYRLALAQAQLAQDQGDWAQALEWLDLAESQYIGGTPMPEVRPVAALKARVWLAMGRLTEAKNWVQQQGLSVDDTLDYVHEFEQITLARTLIAEYEIERTEHALAQALILLGRLVGAAEADERAGNLLELLIVQALAHQADGDIDAALIPLARALALAEPEGYTRRFVDEGPAMAQLLSKAAAAKISPEYVTQLLAAFEIDPGATTPSPPAIRTTLPSSLIEPLSDRELEVLQLIEQGLSNREIGERLYLALDTVKGHNRRIFGKLDVKRRTEAVVRARELGLL